MGYKVFTCPERMIIQLEIDKSDVEMLEGMTNDDGHVDFSCGIKESLPVDIHFHCKE